MRYFFLTLFSISIINNLFAGVEEDFKGFLVTQNFKEVQREISRNINTHFIKDPTNPHIVFLGRSLVLESMILEAIDPEKSSSFPGSNLTNKFPKNLDETTGFNNTSYRDHLKYWLPSLEELNARGQKSIIVTDFAYTGKSTKNFAKLVNEFYEGKIDVKIKVFIGEHHSGERLLFDESEKIRISLKRENIIGRTMLDNFAKYREFEWGKSDPMKLMSNEQTKSYIKNRDLLKRVYIEEDPILSTYIKSLKNLNMKKSCIYKILLDLVL